MMDAALVVGPSWVGDMVMSHTLLQALKQSRPGLPIDVLAPPAALAVCERMPEVRKLIPLNVAHGELALGYRYRLGKELKGYYSEAYVLPNSLKSALVPFFAGIEKRIGYLGEMRYYLLNEPRMLDKRRLPTMTERFVALCGAHAAEFQPKLAVHADNQHRLLSDLGLGSDQPILGLCPGAEFGDAKKWPEAHYASVAKRALSAGNQVWLFGSSKDHATAETINQLAGNECVNLCGKTSLTDVVDLIACCDAVVSNDSGLMHIACATDRKIAVVYGSSSPGFTPPLADGAIIYRNELPCSPCFKRECPLGHKNCLNELKPDGLFNLVDEITRV